MPSLKERLEQFGDPRKTWKWKTGDVDYVSQLDLTAADIPELLAIAPKWAEPMDWPDDENYVAGFAPIHAWRSLAQLRAKEAVPVLLKMMDPLSKNEDDWYLEEFHHVFAWIGPEVIPTLREYLADASHEAFARITVAHSLQEVAAGYPETRDEVVEILTDALSRYEDTDETVNAFVISYLLNLKATEAAEVIEKAHAADRVDISVNGNWNDVRKDLGVPELGLVPEHLANMKWSWGRKSEVDDSFDGLGDDFDDDGYVPAEETAAPILSSGKIGRNESCPCGSGKKYKKCCGG